MPLLPTLTTKLAAKLTEAILKPNTPGPSTPDNHTHAFSSEGNNNKKESTVTEKILAAAKPIALELLGGKVKKESSYDAGGGIGHGGHGGGGIYMSGGRGGRLSAASESGKGGEGAGGLNASYYGYVNHDPHGVLQVRKRR